MSSAPPWKAPVLGGVMRILAIVAVLALALPESAGASARSRGNRDTLMGYARNTWASLVAMTDPHSGLPADNLKDDGTTSVETSTTNIGAYMWSTLVAAKLGIIGHREEVQRLSTTIGTLERMERYWPGGQYYNWYNYHTGEKLTTWPETGAAITPILSSVDNGWLANGLHLVAQTVPEVSHRAEALFDSMDFGFYYKPNVNRIAFYYAPSTNQWACCYDTIISESRIASYIGIAKGEIPQKEYFGSWRSFPNTCDWAWQETKPYGSYQTYYGVRVFEGAYNYAGMRLVPSWGGSMFEDMMPDLFVPEEQWGPHSWKQQHPNYVAAQIYHGLHEAQYGYWGFSPSDDPAGGYRAYGVDAIGMWDVGYTSNDDNTTVDYGFPGCRTGTSIPPPSAYTNGVVSPHAAFLGLPWAPDETLRNLANLKRDFNIYSHWGFRDAVNVDTGKVAPYYLSLDQGIIMAAIGNALGQDFLKKAWATPEFKRRLQPVMKVERFNDTKPRHLH